MQIFIIKAVAHRGERAEHLDRPAADGFAFGLEIALTDADKVDEIGDAHIAVKLELAVGALEDLFLYLVRIVPYLADELLENILHRQYAQRSAVFVGDDGQVLLCLAQLGEHRRQLHGFINIARRHEQTAYIRLLVACKRFEEVIEIQNSDHVIHAVLINRDARERRIFDRFDLIGHVLVDIQRYNVNARGHYLGGHYIRKVYRRLHKLRAILVKDILVLGSLYDGA